MGIGELNVADLPALKRTRRLYEPSAELRCLYDDKFEIFKDVHKRLAPLYHRLNAPQGVSL